LSQFISKDLIHHRDQQSENDKKCQLVILGMEVYELLLAATINPLFQPDFVRLDEIRLAVSEIQNTFSPLLVESLRDVYETRSELQLNMNRIFRSKSWVLGKPVRFLERLLGKDV
jgi:hypothetical protein